MSLTALALSGARVDFGSRRVLRGTDLLVPEGQFLCLLGPSGCGKSTLLRLAAGLLAPTLGRVERASDQVSVVFQEPRLLPWLNVRENIELPFLLQGKAPPAVAPWLARVKLGDSEHLYPHELSGGMKQRVAIARALISEPRLLLMDEPFSALDEGTREELEELLRGLWKDSGMTTVFVTHSLSEAAFLGERILVMSRDQGKWVADLSGSIAPRDLEYRTSPSTQELIKKLSVEMRRARDPGEGAP